MSTKDALEDFDARVFTSAEGVRHEVFWKGTGPAILVISEIPGITPRVAHFARRCVDDGFTAVLPSLFGVPGAPPSTLYALRSIGYACISREFTVLATRRSSPVTLWLRQLARHAHETCGGPGVGVVGMCLTGNFALAMMAEPAVLAPVLSQPSLPFAITPQQRRSLHVTDAELAAVKKRCADGCEVLGLRFTGDAMVPAARFERLRKELGDAFLAVEIDSSRGNPHGIPVTAHSVLTEHLVEEPGHPTMSALRAVMELFHRTLRPPPSSSPTRS